MYYHAGKNYLGLHFIDPVVLCFVFSGSIKTIKINKNELTDFVNNAKATFGAFRSHLDDGGKCCLLISIKF
jgi:hypothetical protein